MTIQYFNIAYDISLTIQVYVSSATYTNLLSVNTQLFIINVYQCRNHYWHLQKLIILQIEKITRKFIVFLAIRIGLLKFSHIMPVICFLKVCILLQAFHPLHMCSDKGITYCKYSVEVFGFNCQSAFGHSIQQLVYTVFGPSQRKGAEEVRVARIKIKSSFIHRKLALRILCITASICIDYHKQS